MSSGEFINSYVRIKDKGYFIWTDGEDIILEENLTTNDREPVAIVVPVSEYTDSTINQFYKMLLSMTPPPEYESYNKNVQIEELKEALDLMGLEKKPALTFSQRQNLNRGMFIQNWDYHFEIDKNGNLRISRTASPRDGGYGIEIDKTIDSSYFKTHNERDLYRYISSLHCSPIASMYDMEAELKELRNYLGEAKLL